MDPVTRMDVYLEDAVMGVPLFRCPEGVKLPNCLRSFEIQSLTEGFRYFNVGPKSPRKNFAYFVNNYTTALWKIVTTKVTEP